MSYFKAENGWLRYRPFNKYQLPELTEEPGKNTFKLSWPGAEEGGICYVHIPWVIARNWDSTPTFGGEDLSLSDYINEQNSYNLPNDLPEVIAYHLAINHKRYNVETSIAGLPHLWVRRVLDAEFTIEPEYLTALKYLKWLAESHIHHPLLTNFDTNVRETLMGINEKAANLYFYLLGDCLYNKNHTWHLVASYLHWVGRVGSGAYEIKSGLDRNEVSKDLWEGLNYWAQWGKERSRINSRESHFILR